MKIVNLFVAAISCLAIGASPSDSIKQCINSLPSDSYSFGYAIATQDKYLVVGDPQANHVVVYVRSQDNKWLRTREILPSKSSTAYKLGSGFGQTLALDRDNLIIGTFTFIEPQDNEVVNPKDFRENDIFSTSTALYQTRLDRDTEVKRIDLPNVPTEGAIPIGTVVADNEKIAFIVSQAKRPSRRIKRINQVYVLSNGKAHTLPGGKLEYRFASRAWRASIYGSSIDLKNNLLLVSVDLAQDRGGVWLFDLNSPQDKPEKLTIPFAAPAIISVAISERFIAISNIPTSSNPYPSKVYGATLIRNIATGSTKIIGGTGGISLDGNILARISSISEDGDFESPKLLEVFRLDDDATPRLIQKRSDVMRTLLQNRLLITVQKTASGKRICTEQIR